MNILSRFGRARPGEQLPPEGASPQEAAPAVGHGAMQETLEQPQEPMEPIEVHVAAVSQHAADPAHIPEFNPAFGRPLTEASESFKLAQDVHADPDAELPPEALKELIGVEQQAAQHPDTGEKLLSRMLQYDGESYDPLIRPYALQVAIKNGAGALALDNLHELKEIGAITRQTAPELIRQGHAYTVGRRLNQFPAGDEQLAHQLIDSGQAQAVLSEYKRFPGLQFNTELAERIIEAGSADLIIRDIEQGRIAGVELNEPTVQKLLETQNGEVVVELAKRGKAPGCEYGPGLLRKLVDTGNADVALIHAPEMGKLPASDAIKAVEQGNAEAILVSDEAFEGLKYDKPLFDAFVTYARDPKLVMRMASKFGLDAPGALDKVTGAKLAARDPELMGKVLYRFGSLDEHTKNHLASQLGYPVEAYPAEGIRPEQDAWYARNAYTYLDGPWPQAKIGQLLRRRIERGREADLHDAAQWLEEFKIPETSPDIDYIKSHRLEDGFTMESVPELRMYDKATELDLLRTICKAPADLRQRFNFSSKPESVTQMFSSPEHQLLYVALVSKDEQGRQFMKQPELSFNALYDAAESQLEDFYAQYQGVVGRKNAKQNNFRLTMTQLRESLGALRREQTLERDTPSGQQASKLAQDLKNYGLNRRRYADDAAEWLLKHNTSPASRLKKVWKDRAMALAMGVEVRDGKRTAIFEDNARSIERWQTDFALVNTVDRLEASGKLAELGFTREEMLSDDQKANRYELGRVLSAPNIVTAMAFMKQSKESRTWSEKRIPATKVEVLPGGEKAGEGLEEGKAASLQTWRFEVLGEDDPRGYTIGEDTACCMTINGASSSCIKAGYSSENAGFMALYTPDDQLAGQSFWYINPNYPDTLVLDNIETNEGRQMTNVMALYKQALQSVLTQSDKDSVKAIRYVNLGEGFTKVDFSELMRVQAIPPLNDSIYTDAAKQRRLLEVER